MKGYGGNTIAIRLRRMGYNFVVGLTVSSYWDAELHFSLVLLVFEAIVWSYLLEF